MFEAAHEAFERWGIGDITRIDVPGRASGEETDDSGIRSAVSAAIPALQSGSLFGGATGVLIVDADQLQKAEADVLAEVIPAIGDDGSIGVVLLAAGVLPSSIDRALKQRAGQVAVRALTERTAVTWLGAAAQNEGSGSGPPYLGGADPSVRVRRGVACPSARPAGCRRWDRHRGHGHRAVPQPS